MSLEILSCRNLKKQFVENQVLQGIDLQINKGESLAIIGASGSGKSTLARLIGGILDPTEGAILIDGVDVRQIDKADIRMNIGIMLTVGKTPNNRIGRRIISQRSAQ